MRSLFQCCAIVFALLVVAGCDSNVTQEEHAHVSLYLQPVYNGQTFVTGQTYDLNGTAISFSTARLYVSQIALHPETGADVSFEADPVTVPAKSSDGSDITHTVTDRILLFKFDAGENEFELGEAPAGRYTGLKFAAGIEGNDNRIDATQVPAGSPLAKQTDRNNHWSWNSGYIYLRLDGLVDADGDGTPETTFETHLGSQNFLRTVDLTGADFQLEGGMAQTIHAMFDLHDVLGQLDFSDPAQRLCHTMDNMPVANKVASSLSSAVHFHGVHAEEAH